MSVKSINVNKVPTKQWRKWSERGRVVFNELFAAMYRNQWAFKMPSAPEAKLNAWKTTCWNAAWIAADAASDAQTIGEVVDLNAKGRAVARRLMAA